MNRFQIDAELGERDAMRHTPAGIPVVSATLLHQSQQIEAQVERQVECVIAAIAAGSIATRLEQLELAQTFRFDGFMARKSRNSKSLVFHIIDISMPTDE
jgi:primosomal replication protein N